jgi:hypothetical protein
MIFNDLALLYASAYIFCGILIYSISPILTLSSHALYCCCNLLIIASQLFFVLLIIEPTMISNKSDARLENSNNVEYN